MDNTSKTFTFRATLIGLVSMVLMGLWVQYHEVLCPYTGQGRKLLEDAPPAGAVGVFLMVLFFVGVLSLIGRRLRLAKGELIFIYGMLMIAAPFMTQGMWHRFPGLIVAIPENKDNLDLIDSFSEKLWPHGEHLVANRRFENELDAAVMTIAPSDRVRRVPVENCQVGKTWGLEMRGSASGKEASLRIRLPRYRGSVDGLDFQAQRDLEQLVPKERYYLTGLFRAVGLTSQSQLRIELIADSGERVPVLTVRKDTRKNYARPGSWLLTVDEVKDWSGLAQRLTQAADATGKTPAARIWQLLPAAAREHFQRIAGAETPVDLAVLQAATEALNRHILQSVEFYDPEFFPGFEPPSEVESRLPKQVTGRSEQEELEEIRAIVGRLPELELRGVNRQMLVKAFPGEVTVAIGFQRLGEPKVILPQKIDKHLDIVFALSGPGAVTITDINFFNNEAIARLRTGSTEVSRDAVEAMPPALQEEMGHNGLLVRSEDLSSPSGILYTIKGYIPYKAWAEPIFYWSTIVLAMFVGLFGIGVIFRKQWSENERFGYPLVAIPRLYLEETELNGRVERPLFRKTTFRIGLGLALLYCLLLGMSHYVPGMPDLAGATRVQLASYFSSPSWKAFMNGYSGNYFGTFEVSLLLMAVAFFIDIELLLSILVCVWLVKIPYAFGEIYGWKNIKGPSDSWPFPHEQHIGSFLSLALIVLWTSRKHLAGVARRVLGMQGGVDDSAESVSYRMALFLIIGAFVYFGFWGAATGLGAGSALLFFGFLVVCGFSAARVRTECGIPVAYWTPYFPYLIFSLLGGLYRFTLETMLLTFVAGGFMGVAQYLLFAPTQVEMLHLAHTENARPKRLKWGLMLGALGGILIGGYVVLVWCYGVGGNSIDYMKSWGLNQNWYFGSLRSAVAQGTPGEFQLPDGQGPWYAVGIGAFITCLLAFLRTRFVGFWLHPLGYVLANTFGIGMCWGSLLVAFCIKWLCLRIGGPRLIREQMRPLFVGLFTGGVLGKLLWDVVSWILLANGVTDVFACQP